MFNLNVWFKFQFWRKKPKLFSTKISKEKYLKWTCKIVIDTHKSLDGFKNSEWTSVMLILGMSIQISILQKEPRNLFD